MKIITVLAAILTVFASTASAADFVLGLGYADFNNDASEDNPAVALEVHGDPFRSFGKIDVSLVGALTAHSNGDAYVGVGVSALRDFDNKWFLEGSFMPGLYDPASSANDLGSTLEFRTLFGVGRRIGEGSRLSLAFDHKSNASTGDINPGVNTLMLRFRRSF